MTLFIMMAIYVVGVVLCGIWVSREVDKDTPADLVALVFLWPLALIGLVLTIICIKLDDFRAHRRKQ